MALAHHPLIAQAQKSVPAKTPALQKDFIARFYAESTREDLDQMDVITLLRTTQLHWDMMNDRKPGKAMIRVHTPETDKDGWPLHRTVIDFVDDDMAFQIDSITAELTRFGQTIHLIAHPLVYVKRGKNGNISAIENKPVSGLNPQSHIHIELNRMLPAAQCKALQISLEQVANDLRHATGDWLAIRAKLRNGQDALSHAPKAYADDEIKDYQAFLEYLYQDNFTLLGYREYHYEKDKNGKSVAKAVRNSHLGLLRREVKTEIMSEGADILPPNLARLGKDKSLLHVFKLSKKSTVHRRVPLDAIMVRLFDAKGKHTGEAIFVGLFTSVTYSRSIRDIPYLSRKTAMIMDRARFEPGSHGHKALSHILEKYPRDELFQINAEMLYDYAISIMRLQERQRIALYTRVDMFEQYISCLVYVPRDRYDTQLRMKIQTILEQDLEGQCQDFYTTLDDSPLARVMFIVTLNKTATPKFDREAIELKLQDAGRAWAEKLSEAFNAKLDDDEKIAGLVARYGNAFPSSYRETYEARQCVHDIFQIEKALESNDLERDLYRPGTDAGHQLRLKLFRPGAPVVLSDILPILENMGLRVIAELPFAVTPDDSAQTVWIHDFQMDLPEAAGKTAIDINAINRNVEELVLQLWHGDVENDNLNRLAITAAMPWRDIVVLRAYVRYMRQGKTAFSKTYLEKALTDHPKIAELLVDLFHARLDPALAKKDGAKDSERMTATIETALNTVTSLDQDRILRAITTMITGTLRTNIFQRDKDGQPKPYMSFKMDSTVIPEIPEPRPYCEIWVYSARMEGIHLRADRIARGGIRWSDRNEDFRTEVLGLMKAQQVKNAIIVPMGAKGGFVLKKPPLGNDRAALQEEGIACYKYLVCGLLDVTDNRKGKKILPPRDVVRHDGDDPYLVVAADKGTATFSDIANALSAEYGFWLGDAFASGGSVGYDHKKMGITARGAWESVKRHFRELGTDIQTTGFDVIGVGDMAGDVFGNGMLLSPHIRLIGAFNHVHIVCDPDPDTASSFKERERLFREVKGWDHYNTKLLSRGGRIYNRSEKSLQLTPEIMARFEISRDRVSPDELMNAMLRTQIDLLWFGGIGTFIKASAESPADVGDKANDAIRIDAPEIRARVIGEGANLGCTQKARVEYATLGGRVNADFIDNSGGVNCSDVEVNIKIAMTDIMNNPANKMNVKKRHDLLAKMTGEVATLVLRNNYQQAQGISLMTLQATTTIVADAQFIRDLEQTQGLKRKLENLPDEVEIERRRAAGFGLVRPELCIVQSYAKIAYTRELLASDIPDQPEMQDFLTSYFPKPLQDKYTPALLGHQLGREIIAMRIANSIVNRMGSTFIKSRMDATNASCADVVRAFLVTREAFGLRHLWDRIEALDGKIPAMVQLNAMMELQHISGHAITWFLTRLGRTPDLTSDIPAFRQNIQKLRDGAEKAMTEKMKVAVDSRYAQALADGMPEDVARDLSLLPVLDSGFDIIKAATESKSDLIATAKAYFIAGEAFYIDRLRIAAALIPANDRWSQEAKTGLMEQLNAVQATLAQKNLKGPATKKAVAPPFPESLLSDGTPDMARLMIAVQRLQQIAR